MHYQILNGSQDTDICVSGHRMDHRRDHRTDHIVLDTVDKLNCQLEWPGQIGFIIVSLYVLLRANQLTVIIIFNCYINLSS